MQTQESSQGIHLFVSTSSCLNSQMNSRRFIVKLLFFIVIGGCSSDLDRFYGTCDGSFSCGTASGFGYPFRRHQDPEYCGYPGFELNCDEQNPPTIDITNIAYQVLGIDPMSQILKIVREDMINSICPQDLVNTTINFELFDYTLSYMNISFLFGCPVPFNVAGTGSIICSNHGLSPVFLLPRIHAPDICETSVIIPVPIRFVDPNELGQVLQEGFEVRWKMEDTPCTSCTQSGGQCMYDNNTSLTMCACPESHFLDDSCSTVNKTQVSSSPSSGM